MTPLDTPRCHLRSLIHADFQSILDLHSDSEVRRYLGGPKDPDQIRKEFESQLLSDSPYCVVTMKNDGSFLGVISLDPHHDEKDIEISYVFARVGWGRGFATETLSAVVDCAFHELDLPRLVSETQTANIASRRLLERQGFQFERNVMRFESEQVVYAKSR